MSQLLHAFWFRSSLAAFAFELYIVQNAGNVLYLLLEHVHKLVRLGVWQEWPSFGAWWCVHFDGGLCKQCQICSCHKAQPGSSFNCRHAALSPATCIAACHAPARRDVALQITSSPRQRWGTGNPWVCLHVNAWTLSEGLCCMSHDCQFVYILLT